MLLASSTSCVRPLINRFLGLFAARMASIDATQAKLLEERCILVDEDDSVKGWATKRDCHLKENIVEFGMLHRAFSVFLFNSRGELLMQQRADTKITFPDHYTNTCCSHPLYEEAELEERGQIGVRRAAQRRIEYELGIPKAEIPIDQLQFLTRILYRAQSSNMWGEHELDYIFFIQRDVKFKPNINEVKDCRFMDQQEVKDLLRREEAGKVLVTPWFKLIAREMLFKWWDNLHSLDVHKDPQTIHKM